MDHIFREKNYCKLLILSFFLLASFPADAQMFDYKGIFSKPYNERITNMGEIRLRIAKTADKKLVDEEIRLIEQAAAELNKKSILKEAALVKAYCYDYNGWQPPKECIKTIRNAIQGIKSTDDIFYIRVMGMMQIADVYWERLSDYESYFEEYNEIIDFVKDIKQEDYPDLTEIHRRLGNAYYYFGDYENAVKYFKMAIVHPETSQNFYFLAHSLNGLGLCYQKFEKPDSADYFFKQILRQKYNPRMEEWDGIVSGNLARSETMRKNYDKAIPLFIKDIHIALKHEDFGLASGALTSLAEIYIEKNRFPEAKSALDSAYNYIKLSGQTDRFHSYFPILSRWYVSTGNKAQALAYMDSAETAINNYNKKFNSLKLMRVQQKIANQQLQLEKANLKSERYRNQLYLVLLIGSILFFILIAYAYRRRQQIKLYKKEVELKRKENQLQVTRHDLQVAQLNLDNFMKSVFEKNELILDLTDQLKIQEKSPELEQLRNSIILTQNDWDTFQKLFEEVYPGYRFHLKEKHPNLTSAELRYLLLEKLQLSTKEMASMLGVSPNAVQVTRHRLQKKII